MAESDRPSEQSKPISSPPDTLVKTGKKDSVKLTELTDDELKKVSGGDLRLGRKDNSKFGMGVC